MRFRSKFLLPASVLLFLLAVLFVFMMSSQKKQSSPIPTPAPVASVTPGVTPQSGLDYINNISKIALQAPVAQFATWSGLQAPAGLPNSTLIYKLKSNLTAEEARALASKLQAGTELIQRGNSLVGYGFTADGNEAAMAVIDLNTGTFTYNSTVGVPLPSGGSVQDRARSFLRDLGINDPTLQAAGTYKNRKAQGLTYIELHRILNTGQFPVLNAMGLLNVSDSVPLSSLSAGKIIPGNEPEANADIYETSDNTDGFKRATDFNTITIVIDDATQHVKLVKSTMHLLSTLAPQSAGLISFDEAVSQLKQGTYDFILTTPTGAGEGIPWESIYPGNKAVADNAQVTETMVAYLEQPPFAPQAELHPYYLIRGTAQLTNGYATKFVAAVKATKQTVGLLESFAPPVEAQTIPGQGGQQQTSFKPNTDPTRQLGTPITPREPLPTGVINETPILPDTPTVCRPSVASLNPVVTININGADYFFGHGLRGDGKAREWHFIPTQSTIMQDSVFIANLSNIVAYLQTAVGTSGVNVQGESTMAQNSPNITIYKTNPIDTGQKQSTIKLTPEPTLALRALITGLPHAEKIRKFDKIIDEIQNKHDYCPVRLTGSSPSVFVYGPVGTEFTVHPQARLTYIDPAGEGIWAGRIAHNGLSVNGGKRDYLYYEYTDVSYEKPSAGWNITKNSIESFVHHTFAPRAGLNAKEIERTIFELNHAATKMHSDTITVGLLEESVVDQKVPLIVSLAKKVYRYHFYVSAGKSVQQSPKIQQIERDGLTIVEIGSYAGK